MGKSRVRNFLRSPPQDGVKLFVPPLLKSGNFRENEARELVCSDATAKRSGDQSFFWKGFLCVTSLFKKQNKKKSGNFTCPTYNMAKTSSYRVKTTPKLLCPPPPFRMAKTFPPPHFHRGKNSRAPPPPVLLAPPPRDQSLRFT